MHPCTRRAQSNGCACWFACAEAAAAGNANAMYALGHALGGEPNHAAEWWAKAAAKGHAHAAAYLGQVGMHYESVW